VKEEQAEAEKHLVTKLMNKAAGHAKQFEEATKVHDDAKAKLNEARKVDKEQELNVKEAEKMVEKEKKARKKTQMKVKEAGKTAQKLKYKAEYKGSEYKEAKEAAVQADKDLHHRQRQNEEQEYFAKVAEEAVKKAAEQKKRNEQQINADVQADAVKLKAANPAATVDLKDCTTLPKQYTEKGGKCSDCPDWARMRRCEQADFKVFMNKFCAKSCAGVPPVTASKSAPPVEAPAAVEAKEAADKTAAAAVTTHEAAKAKAANAAATEDGPAVSMPMPL